ncbi:MAG: hypothetical protein HYX42_03990 [Polaromonas sp.]|uniref:hypothetical protein n=1 Tax=Polaromonas sp. TaxID=1869339 RepID=UPI0025D223BE|nr:hypothetical protein [Polaromonas sp.]MBI2725391.1 hypothetical protein [Polaromonas sp.]
MIWLAISPLGLFLLYVLYVQYERGGFWVAFKVFGIFGYPLDVFYNMLMCFFTWQKPVAWTITVQLPAIAKVPGWRGEFAIALANFLNWFAPSGQHVKLR